MHLTKLHFVWFPFCFCFCFFLFFISFDYFDLLPRVLVASDARFSGKAVEVRDYVGVPDLAFFHGLRR